MTPRRAGIRSDQATVRAQPEDRPVEPWEDRAVEPRLEIRLEVRMEDQPAEPRQPTRRLLTGSSIPSEAPAAGLDRALDRHRPRTRVLRRVPMSTAVTRDSATGVDAEASAFVEATEAMAGTGRRTGIAHGWAMTILRPTFTPTRTAQMPPRSPQTRADPQASPAHGV
jgi:hypothetical protein